MTEPQLNCLNRLEDDHGNLDAALTWSLQNSFIVGPVQDESQILFETPLLFCGALIGFWLRRGYLSEGREWCEKALAAEGSEEPTVGRAKTLLGLGVLIRNQGDFASALVRYEQSLEMFRKVGDKWGIAASLGNLGHVALAHGNYDGAQAYYEEGLAIRRDIGDKLDIAVSLNSLGGLAQQRGDHASAWTYMSEALLIYRAHQHLWGIPATLYGLGNLERDRRDFVAARTYHKESLQMFQEIVDKQSIAASLEAFASLFVAEANAVKDPSETTRLSKNAPVDLRGAALLWGAAKALREETGSPLPPHERDKYDRNVDDARATLGDATFSATLADGHAMSMEQAIAYALAAADE